MGLGFRVQGFSLASRAPESLVLVLMHSAIRASFANTKLNSEL